jgi:triosephosphate isomerase
VRLARALEVAAEDSHVQVVLAVQAADIGPVSAATKLAVIAQHVDGTDLGPYTGSVVPEAAAGAGAAGTLLNHSERGLDPKGLEAAVRRAKQARLDVVVCARRVREAARLSKIGADFVAIEPPELIAGDVSVSEARPGLIKEAAAVVKKVPLLCGAGIKNAGDVRRAVELGAQGVLVASGIVLSKDPAASLANLLKGFTLRSL